MLLLSASKNVGFIVNIYQPVIRYALLQIVKHTDCNNVELKCVAIKILENNESVVNASIIM